MTKFAITQQHIDSAEEARKSSRPLERICPVAQAFFAMGYTDTRVTRTMIYAWGSEIAWDQDIPVRPEVLAYMDYWDEHQWAVPVILPVGPPEVTA